MIDMSSKDADCICVKIGAVPRRRSGRFARTGLQKGGTLDEAAAEKSPHPTGGRRAAPLPPVYRFLLKRRCIVSRISKNVAEYFPHFAADSRTKSILESRFGNDGYAFWFKLLELLCKTDGHSYDCRNALDWEYLLGYTRVSAETAGQILDLLAGMGKIDQPLWADGQTIWCQALVENLRPVYEKRRRLPPEKPLLGRESPGRVDYFPEKKPGKDFSPQAVPEKRQSRGKKSRGEKSKEESPCSPPAGDGGRFSFDGKGEKAGTKGEGAQEAQEAFRTSGKVGTQGKEALWTNGKAETQDEGAQGTQEVFRTGGKVGMQGKGVQEAFERFWTAYPRKVGKGRAEKLFVRLKPDHRLLDTMLTAIEQAKGSEQWQRDQGRYIPNPSTWLGQRRWEDEPFPDSPAYCGNLDPPGHAPPCALPPELAREKERREEALRRFRAGECGWEELMPE